MMTPFTYGHLELSLPDDWTGNVIQQGPNAVPMAMIGPREESRLDECVVQFSGHDFGLPVSREGLREIMMQQGTPRDTIREFAVGPWTGVGTERVDGEVHYLSLFLGSGTTAIFLLFSAPAAWYTGHRASLWSILESARLGR